MITAVWLPPLVKALATALIVVCASVVAEALGPFWGALIASLPVSAGPAYVFLAMQHGTDFVAASALGSCAANAVTGLFLIAYGALARKTSPWRGLAAAVSVWLAAGLAAQKVTWTPTSALLLNLIVYGAGFALLGAISNSGPEAARPVQRRWFDIPVRAIAVATFVSVIVGVSTILGPKATGIAAVFPVSLISLIVIVRPRLGGPASALLAANALRPMLGFGVMLLALHLTVRPWGSAASLSLAMAISALWSGALLLLRVRGDQSAVAKG
ncbi:MAG: hypothetical protein B7Z80_09795 [Rhodospirillales bacterium 20-64-7]|nr:MAG: hypothetical protein B7Z80_09795 [Rhodospirillales bacterium 20-64-7]